MKKSMIITVFLLALFFIPFGTQVYAENACMQICRETNKSEVNWCMYPPREPQATRECLNDVRRNYDACIQACGR